MDRFRDRRSQYVDDDPDSGGMSAGAQNGGIVDTGAADNETEYADDLAGRKGGSGGIDSMDSIAGVGSDEDFVGGGNFEDEEESAGIGGLTDIDDI